MYKLYQQLLNSIPCYITIIFRDTAYTTDDIESMYVQSLYKQITGRETKSVISNAAVVSRENLMSPNDLSRDHLTMSRDQLAMSRDQLAMSRENLVRSTTPGLLCEEIPTITPGRHATEMAVMPSNVMVANSASRDNAMATGNNSIVTSRENVMVTRSNASMQMTPRDNVMVSRQTSLGTVNSIDRVSATDKMTESVETQVIAKSILRFYPKIVTSCNLINLEI